MRPRGHVPDTNETREKKGRLTERQRLEADIEHALEAVGLGPDVPLEHPAIEEAFDGSIEEFQRRPHPKRSCR